MANEYSGLQSIIDNAQYEAKGTGRWDTWLLAQDAEAHQRLLTEASEWVEGRPSDYDYDDTNWESNLGQGYAMNYFQNEFEFCHEFKISIIEGECPGSSYYAAELGMSVEEANALTEKLGIPIRFAWLET